MLFDRVNHGMGRRGRDGCSSLIESFGVGWIHLVLMSIDRIAQGELDLAFRTGQRKAVRRLRVMSKA